MCITLSDKYDKKVNISPNDNKNEASSDDLVHQHNEALSSDIVKHNVQRRKKLLMSLTKICFQFKVIKFTNYFMYNYDLKMLREKNQATNVSPNNK